MPSTCRTCSTARHDAHGEALDLLLASGFGDGMGGLLDGVDRTLQALHDTILEALFNGGCWPGLFDQLFGKTADGRGRTPQARSSNWKSWSSRSSSA
jgi:hypothetical protein